MLFSRTTPPLCLVLPFKLALISSTPAILDHDPCPSLRIDAFDDVCRVSLEKHILNLMAELPRDCPDIDDFSQLVGGS